MKLLNIKSTVLVTAFASGTAFDAPALLHGVVEDVRRILFIYAFFSRRILLTLTHPSPRLSIPLNFVIAHQCDLERRCVG